MGWVSKLGAWLDRRFPEKMSLDEVRRLCDAHTHPQFVDPILMQRLDRMEADISKIKVVINLRNLVKS